ncbi:MAG: YicC family protein [SAR86 cluster bacterium]|uniref:YicC family protein n=1 Tax=SAR86 cluster bacterium TaxID=2030880 RepID=A0A2A4X3C7_9GAMM|nr:MAG: YicC family protein [SAR86 cluster bacterium]
MTSSMTAFSRQQQEQEWGSLTWEIRSVNHRYLETSVRLPESFRALENGVREAVRKRLTRGKVECALRFQSEAKVSSDLHLNKKLIKQLVQANIEIEQITGTSISLSNMEVLRWPGVIEEQDFDKTSIEKQALSLFGAALDDLVATREREGAELQGFIKQRIDSVREIVVSIRSKMPEILAKQKQNILDRLAELQAELEPTRLEQEVSLLAQKADVEEELDRLHSHLNEVERVLGAKGQKGRRLDFLMQELNREANTLSSKSIVVETTLSAVELKVLIEQMREQIQNVE